MSLIMATSGTEDYGSVREENSSENKSLLFLAIPDCSWSGLLDLG